jgi:hypothetical protein
MDHGDRLAAVVHPERDLEAGDGVWRQTADLGPAACRLAERRAALRRRQEVLAGPGLTRRQRRNLGSDLDRLTGEEAKAVAEFDQLAEPARRALAAMRRQLETRVAGLRNDAGDRDEWLAQHPEVARRLQAIATDLRMVQHEPELAHRIERAITLDPPPPNPPLQQDLGMDLSL